MSDAELEEANEQLARPASIDLAGAQRLGFYVVGRLAARHGVKVRLRRSWFGGVAALVLLPTALLGGPETDLQPAGRPAPAQPEVEPDRPEGPGEPQRGAPVGWEGPGAQGTPVPGHAPRAFAVRSPGAGPDDGMAG
jgi:hypothetical protein